MKSFHKSSIFTLSYALIKAFFTEITSQTIITFKAIDNEGLEAIEVVKVKVNGKIVLE